jgi:5-methylcytosine-specific restriction endonuclease McrA
MYCKTSPAVVCDHVVPISKGGTKDPMNLVACCKPCNDSKLDRLLPEDLATIIDGEILANTEKYLGIKAS